MIALNSSNSGMLAFSLNKTPNLLILWVGFVFGFFFPESCFLSKLSLFVNREIEILFKFE